MNRLYRNLLDDAARLSRSGDLRAAVDSIQATLGRLSGVPASDAAQVIDVQAREVPDTQRRVDPQVGARQGNFIAGTHKAPAGTRDYKLFVPPQHGTAPLPLVVMLHGCTQNPDDFAAGTRMNEAALAQGFFVLYPAQPQTANAQGCWNWFKHSHQQRGRGEPAILAAMTRDVMKQYGIDPERVYVAGLSAGGAMAAILGETYPDVFAAVGVHSGIAAGAASDLGSAFAVMQGNAVDAPMSTGLAGLSPLRGNGAKRPDTRNRPQRDGQAAGRPTIVFHGDRDTTVHPVNGEHVIAASVGAESNASGEPDRRSDGNGRTYTRRSYRDAQGRVRAEHWLVHGAGHAWSGGNAAGSFTDPQGPDATREMLRFFWTQRRGNADA